MQNQLYLAQLHMHTSDTSRCGGSTGGEMARACKDAGYDVIVITDHFMNANINCSPTLPWEERVDYLFRGYRAAKAVGDRIGLTVLKGWETFNDGPEYLTYGLDERFLLDNPDIADVGASEYLSRVRAAGAFVTHAHPYREADYIPYFKPDWRHVDAYEVLNSAHTDPRFDQRALLEARKRGLIMLPGSDAHRTGEVRGGATVLPGPVRDMDGLIEALRSRECKIAPRIYTNPNL